VATRSSSCTRGRPIGESLRSRRARAVDFRAH
jgi:hypothetical protein